MSYARRPSFWLAMACVAFYGLRAFSAWMDGWTYPIGKRLAGEGRHELALPLLDRGAIGPKRPAALWLAGQARMALWHQRALAGEPAGETDLLLRDAFRNHTEALSLSPASGWYRASLAEVYHRQEQVERFRHDAPMELMGHGPWAFVGRPGRIAIGLTRLGIAREPTWFLFRDQLALMLLDDYLYGPGREAVRESAAALPYYPAHLYRDLEPVPDAILEAFAEGAREALGRAPLLSPVGHLLALGRLEYRLGRWEQSVEDFTSVLAVPSAAGYRAQANLYLGLALIELKRFDEAERALAEAQDHPGTAIAALAARGRLAEAMGDLEGALDRLRDARRLEPRQLRFTLEFARVARRLGEWTKAEEALRWALTLAPERADLVGQLIEVYIEEGESAKAWALLNDLKRMPGTEEQIRGLQERLSSRTK